MVKLDLSCRTKWDHHYSGWGDCVDTLLPLNDPNGVLFIDYVEKIIQEKRNISRPWVGVVHNTIVHPPIIKRLYGEENDLDLKTIVQSKVWKHNLSKCLGIFCLSTENADFLRGQTSLPIDVLYHATRVPKQKFDPDLFRANLDKKLILVGHWMRNFQSIYDLKSPLKKVILKGADFPYEKLAENFCTNDTVFEIERVSNFVYDEMLSENIVFLSLLGSSANNAVVESMVRFTPVLINRLPALEEYLGKEYPLFYTSLEEAEMLLSDALIIKAHQYLINRQFTKILTLQAFFESFVNSRIYKSLKTYKVFL